jgi:DNA end-binding protein Ku
VLQYAVDLRPVEEFEKLLDDAPVSAQELKLAKTLIEATSADKANLEDFRNLYTERLRELVDAKVAGRKIVKSKSGGKLPQTINIIDALKASLEFKKTRAAARPGKPARARRAPPKKRKTG